MTIIDRIESLLNVIDPYICFLAVWFSGVSAMMTVVLLVQENGMAVLTGAISLTLAYAPQLIAAPYHPRNSIEEP